MDGQSDGRYPPPSGIARDAVNLTGAAQVLHILTYCASLANAELLIYSTPAPPGADFVALASVPDASDFVGMTVGGSIPASAVTLDDLSGVDGLMTSQIPSSMARARGPSRASSCAGRARLPGRRQRAP